MRHVHLPFTVPVLLLLALVVLAFSPAASLGEPTRLYVAGDGGVTVLQDNQIQTTIPLPNGVTSIAMQPPGTHVYAVAYGSLVTIDTATDAILGTTALPTPGLYVVANPVAHRVYVTTEGPPWDVMVIDTVSNTFISSIPLGDQPMGTIVSPVGDRVYVAMNGGQNAATRDTVAVIDAATNTVSTYVSIRKASDLDNSTSPFGLALNKSGSRLYVTRDWFQRVSVLDTETYAVLAEVVVGNNPEGIALSLDDAYAFVSNTGSATVSIIDTHTNTVIHTLMIPPSDPGDSGGFFSTMAADPSGSYIYVPTAASGTIAVIDSHSGALIDLVAAGWHPSGIAIRP